MLASSRGRAAPHHSPPKVGYAPTGPVFSPCGDESEAAIAEAYRRTMEVEGCYSISWWCDPVLLGRVPEPMAKALGADVFTPQELELLHQPLDYLGFNVYNACAAQQPGSEYTAKHLAGQPAHCDGMAHHAGLHLLGHPLFEPAVWPAHPDYRERHGQHRFCDAGR